ncbi:dihydrofolate reductase family protein [Thermogemmatispora sp.]|uniref:dihydrofolate reductase family protein n=1 Tax=Thermogemmatispora sp. TaxID=1968838 RepID=UPI0035E3F518
MTIKCSVYCGASLDGFIAGHGGDIEWLHRPEYDDAGMTGLTYDRFIASVDAIIMGRHTFEKLLTFNAWPYKVPVIVLSTSLKDLPEHVRGKARLMVGSPEEIVRQLASEGHRHLYVDGGITIQRFLRARLIHEITITYLPVLLGEGIPLFGSVGIETRLKLLEAVSYKDFVQLRYQVVHPLG